MSQEFLPKILKEKAREVAVMKEEELQPLRETYRLYDYLVIQKSFRSLRK